MPIDLRDQGKLIPLNMAGKISPHISSAQLVYYARKGILRKTEPRIRVKLETVEMGNRTFTTMDAYVRFCHALGPNTVVPEPSESR